MIHGLDDIFLMAETLNDTRRYLENDLSLITVPKAGWVHLDAADLVTSTFFMNWLVDRPRHEAWAETTDGNGTGRRRSTLPQKVSSHFLFLDDH